MNDVDKLFAARQNVGLTEPYVMYNGAVELRFEPKTHTYYLVTPNGLVKQQGVSTVCKVIDKSEALIPWACKMMAQKLIETVKVDGISSFTAPLSPTDLTSWINNAKSAHKEKLDAAAFVGNQAHDFIERYIKSYLSFNQETVALPENEQARNCSRAALDWMARHNVRWLHTEKKVYSRNYEFAGTMDGLCYIDSCLGDCCYGKDFKNRLSVADWKSSNHLQIEYLLQTAAYQVAYEEEYGVQIEDRWVIRLGKEDGEFDPWHLERDVLSDDFDAFIWALELTRSVDDLTSRMKGRNEVIKARRKEERQAEKQANLALRCKGYETYKGVRPPKVVFTYTPPGTHPSPEFKELNEIPGTATYHDWISIGFDLDKGTFKPVSEWTAEEKAIWTAVFGSIATLEK
jgi:hypothetical protein